MKVGILGGSFNPVHLGHLRIAEETRGRHGLDKVVFIPAGDPPHKELTELASGSDRLEMVKLAIKDNPRFEASDIEVLRPGKSYTIDTVTRLQLQLGAEVELYFIIGADTIRELPTWRSLAELVELCQFVTVARRGFDSGDFEALRDVVSDLALRNMKAMYLDIAPVDISASEIRQRVRAGLSIDGLVPGAVESYIVEKHLYL